MRDADLEVPEAVEEADIAVEDAATLDAIDEASVELPSKIISSSEYGVACHG